MIKNDTDRHDDIQTKYIDKNYALKEKHLFKLCGNKLKKKSLSKY